MSKWYEHGLDFGCAQCGRCCGGSPGVVWVDREEIRRIAAALELPQDKLWGPFLRRVGITRVSLVERANGDCVFLKHGADGSSSCTIYDIRPQQCRTWPFWDQNLSNPASWQDAASRCPGFNCGLHFDLARIEAIRLAPPWYKQADTPQK